MENSASAMACRTLDGNCSDAVGQTSGLSWETQIFAEILAILVIMLLLCNQKDENE